MCVSRDTPSSREEMNGEGTWDWDAASGRVGEDKESREAMEQEAGSGWEVGLLHKTRRDDCSK